MSTNNFNDEVQYQVYQGDKLITQTKGTSKATIGIEVDKFKEGKNIKVKVCDMSGNILSSKKLNLSLIKYNINLGKNGGIDFGKDIEITLPKQLGPLNGTKITIPMEELLKIDNIEQIYEMSSEQVKVGLAYGLGNPVQLYKGSLEKEIKKILNSKYGTAKKKVGLEAKLAVYVELNFDDGVMTTTKGYGAFSITYKAERGANVMVSVIPITVKVKASLGGTVQLGIEFDYTEEQLKLIADLIINGSIQPQIGVGVNDIVSIGVYGKIEASAKFDINKNFKFKKFELTGEAGFYGELFKHEVTVPIITPTTKVTCDENGNWSVESINDAREMSIYNLDNYSRVSDKMKSSNAIWTNTNNQNNENALITEGIYTHANQEIVTNGEDTLMIFIDDDSENNIKTLKYSIYDKENRKWQTPCALDGNKLQDNNFVTYTDGINIYCIYTQEKIELDEDAPIENYAPNQEIVFTKWSNIDKRFVESSVITNNDTYDMLPDMTIIDENPAVVWVNNASNNPFGTTTDNSILYSKLENEIWSEPTKLIENENSIVELEVGKINNQEYIIAIIDEDNDLMTSNDRILKIIDFNKNEKVLSTGNNSNIKIINDKDKELLTWYENGNINTLSNINDKAQKLVENDSISVLPNYQLINDKNDLAIIYMAETEKGYGIYEIVRDENDQFGKPILIVEQENRITNYSAIFLAEELLVNYITTEFIVDGDNLEKYSRLYSNSIVDKLDLEIYDVEYDNRSFKFNEHSQFKIFIKNNGQLKAKNINIKIEDDYGNEIYNQAFDKGISSGKMEEFILDNVEIREANEYKIIVSDTENEETNKEDNEYLVKIRYSDLEVTAEQIVTEKTDYALVKISNNGNTTTQNTRLNIIKNDEIVDMMIIEDIQADDCQVIWVNLKDKYLEKDKDTKLKFEVSNDVEEISNINNDYILTVVNYPEEDPDDTKLGDINANGIIDTEDARMIFKYYIGATTLTEEQMRKADVTKDNIIDTQDARKILLYCVGQTQI